MEQNIIVQAVRCNRVIDVVVFICIPVFSQLFRTKHKDGLVTVLIVFYNRQCSEGFTETNAVCKNAAVVFFQFVDNGENGVFLEVIASTKSCSL